MITPFRTFRRAAAAAATVVLLSACETTVSTTFDVTSETEVTTTITVTFDGAAADAATTNIDQVRNVIAQRSGVELDAVKVATSDDQVTLTVTPLPDALTANEGLSGIRDARVGPPPDGRGNDGDVAMTVVVVAPTGIADAIRAAVAEQPDAAALADATLGSTKMSVTVNFAGGVHDADFTPDDGGPSAVEVTSTDTNANFTQPVARAQAGTFLVIGDPTEQPSLEKWGRWIAFSMLAGGVLVWAVRRDRRNRRIH